MEVEGTPKGAEDAAMANAKERATENPAKGPEREAGKDDDASDKQEPARRLRGIGGGRCVRWLELGLAAPVLEAYSGPAALFSR